MRRARLAAGLVTALALAGLLALVFANPSSAQPRVYRIGVIDLGGPYAQVVDGLREGLRDLGLEEGKQYALLIRDTGGDLKAVERFAKALEDDGVDVLFTAGSSVTVTAMKATRRVPIVFHSGADPVTIGLVENFRKPGGRLTGLTSQSRDLGPKRLEILKEIVPTIRVVAVFYNPSSPAQSSLRAIREAAQGLKLQLVERQVRSIDDLHASLRALRPGEVDAIFYVGDALVASQAQTTIAVANAKRLPTMYWEVGTVGMGALASYGVSYRALGRQSATYVQRVLLGAKPGDLPVERVDRFHLALNLKTAKAIGVTIPKAVLDRADEIIQ
jgi:putative ABC transport system substrate-binding protein